MLMPRVLTACVLALAAIAPVASSASDVADELRAIERQRLHALVEADIATARALHADDFELITPVGGTLSKEQYLRDVESGDLDYLEWEPEQIRVRVYGDAAVIRYKANLRVSVKGSPGRPVTFWHTDLYERRAGLWQIVWAHATRVQTP
jgi:ketosteroid isomerase-like protein